LFNVSCSLLDAAVVIFGLMNCCSCLSVCSCGGVNAYQLDDEGYPWQRTQEEKGNSTTAFCHVVVSPAHAVGAVPVSVVGFSLLFGAVIIATNQSGRSLNCHL
jgi:hypothetical protein